MPADDALGTWEFPLPGSLIARHPPDHRGASRLMHLPLEGGPATDHGFDDLGSLLRAGDLLVANDSRVMAARLQARRASGGRVELLLLEPGPGAVHALARPARKLKRGDHLTLEDGTGVTVRREAVDGVVVVALDRDPAAVMAELGALPLPPYLGRDAEPADTERYQTVYAAELGSAAAPTAGLHFTRRRIEALAAQGIGWSTVTLHVGLGTFLPVRPADLERGRLHEERYVVPSATAEHIARVRRDGGRVIAVGTTSLRTLESATATGARVPRAGPGRTDLFVRPGHRFTTVDGLLTNFHLPGSSLLMLVGALVGRQRVLDAYATAVQRGYRFYSYGDAMLLV